jgi:hypothetical protein
MPFGRDAALIANHCDERISRLTGGGCRARLVCPARPVRLAGCDPSDTKARSLRAPNGAIAVPDANGRAPEDLAGGNDLYGQQ